MDWFAVPLAWITIVVIEAALAGLGYLAYFQAQQYFDLNDGAKNSSSTSLLWIASICWIAAGIYYLIMFCNFKSLRVSIAIIETAADFFADTKRIVFVPLVYFSVWVGLFIFWLWGLCGVLSISPDGIDGITITNVQF
jgi:hypothetical protein